MRRYVRGGAAPRGGEIGRQHRQFQSLLDLTLVRRPAFVALMAAAFPYLTYAGI